MNSITCSGKLKSQPLRIAINPLEDGTGQMKEKQIVSIKWTTRLGVFSSGFYIDERHLRPTNLQGMHI